MINREKEGVSGERGSNWNGFWMRCKRRDGKKYAKGSTKEEQ